MKNIFYLSTSQHLHSLKTINSFLARPLDKYKLPLGFFRLWNPTGTGVDHLEAAAVSNKRHVSPALRIECGKVGTERKRRPDGQFTHLKG